MKQTIPLILSGLLITGSSLAGGAKEVIPAPPPPEPAPEWSWFVGASAGYLMDFEEPMYHAHFGVEFAGRSAWRHALFLEAGWTEGEESSLFQVDGMGIATSELEVLPVTLNYKLERAFDSGFYVYGGVGAGVAFLDSSTTARFPAGYTPRVRRAETSDEVFAAQIFAGMGYHVTPDFELYGGARWIYLDDQDAPSIPGLPGRQGFGSVEDDVLVELGLRYNF